MKRTLFGKLAFITSLFTVSFADTAFAQDTTFTYQGRLEAANVPANFDHGFLVRLFDAEGGGNQIGSTVCKEFVDVVNGLFTLELDFGSAVGSESLRFLDIQVKESGNCSDTTGYTQLTPRQRLTATPRAAHALVAVQAESAGLAEHAGFSDLATAAQRLDAPDGSPTSAVFVNNVGNVGIGTTAPTAKLDVRGDIRLGPSGEYRAVSGGENLRIVRGLIRGTDGAVLQGSGFTATRTGVGRYTITFNTPFASFATITATSDANSCFGCIMQTVGVGTTAANLHVIIPSGPVTDTTFHFIAVGPR